MHFNNLKEVEDFITENLPDWTISKTSTKSICSYDNITHAKNAEFVKIFKPGEHNKPFAECWKGFYSFIPESYLALMRTHFTDIDYAMKNVIEEDKILKNSSRILTAIKQVISEDETLKAICKREIVASDIHWCRSAGNNTCWDISINAFTCTKGKTCILKIKDGIKSLNVSYEIIDANNVKNIYESKSVCVII